MYQFKIPYSKFARFYIDADHLLEKSKKYFYGWLPCYNCEHRLYDHVSYDHLSDWNGVCISFSSTNEYSCTCGCEEYDFFSFIRYFIPNLKLRLRSNSSVNEKK